jgi:hypothetical protein
MDEGKIYNVCLQRVKFQITNAMQRLNNDTPPSGRLILESYNTGDIEEIIDILEIYDLEDRTLAGLAEKLEDLAYTVSALVRKKIAFDYDEKGNLGLYLVVDESTEEVFSGTRSALAVA